MLHHVILGAGPAGVIAAETLRRQSPNDRITLVGDEHEPPYSRMAIPYLLIGNIDERGTYLRKSDDHFNRLCIEEVRARAQSVDAKKREVHLDNGQTLAFDRLLIATGSRPVRPPIPGIDSPQVHPCWTLEDARAIQRLAQPGARVLQMGAGFIGCIIMEALANRGVELSVVEMGDRMVPRMMNDPAGNMTQAGSTSIQYDAAKRVTGKTKCIIPVHLCNTGLNVLPYVGISSLEEQHLQFFFELLLLELHRVLQLGDAVVLGQHPAAKHEHDDDEHGGDESGTIHSSSF